MEERGIMLPNVSQRKRKRRSCKSLGVIRNLVNQVKNNPMEVKNALTS